MPTPLYIYLPILFGIVACVGMFVWGRSDSDRGTHFGLTLCNAISSGWSAFFAGAVLLLAFVPGLGTNGPVQYWAGSDEAMGIFRFRGTLFIAGAGLFLWCSIQAIAAVCSVFTKHRRLIVCSVLALCADIGALLAGFATLGKWMPSV